MALIACPECGKNISDKSHACMQCGFPLFLLVKNTDQPKVDIPARTSEESNTVSEPPKESPIVTKDWQITPSRVNRGSQKNVFDHIIEYASRFRKKTSINAVINIFFYISYASILTFALNSENKSPLTSEENLLNLILLYFLLFQIQKALNFFANEITKELSNTKKIKSEKEYEMAIINCIECGREISDKSERCIHCGNPIKTNENIATYPIDEKTLRKSNYEEKARSAVDALFSIIYVFLLFNLFFGNEIDLLDSAASFFGVIFAFAIIIFVHKVIRFIVGSIAKNFDGI